MEPDRYEKEFLEMLRNAKDREKFLEIALEVISYFLLEEQSERLNMDPSKL